MKEQLAKLPVIFVTGGPGSGKGTQCDKIVKEFNFTHLSSGDLLRAKVASGSADGKELDAMMKAGKLVPLEKVLDLITEAMNKAVSSGSCNGFLIDGYPREIDQGIKFEAKIKPCSLVIDFDVPDEVMVTRLVERGKTSGRVDDNEETIRARLKTYREATVPVAEHYQKQNKLNRIDANRTVDEVFGDVIKAFATIGLEPSGFSQPVFFIVGGPGSGKGTQCEKIVAEFHFTHLSSGDLLRAEVASGSEKGKALDQAMKAGELVTTETVLELMKNAMEKERSTSKGYLIDGYPRKVEQGELFEKIVAPCAACIFFDVSAEEMKKRLMKRGETSGRADDNEETISKRLVTFDNETKPVLSYYEGKGKLNRINAERGVDEIYADVRNVLLNFVKS